MSPLNFINPELAICISGLELLSPKRRPNKAGEISQRAIVSRKVRREKEELKARIARLQKQISLPDKKERDKRALSDALHQLQRLNTEFPGK